MTFIALGVLVLVIMVVGVGIIVNAVIRGRRPPNTVANGPNTGGPTDVIAGASGSTIKMEDGASFTYVNEFGGDWASDPTQPFAAGGKAQSWSKRVGTEQWIWGTDIARGVNLGWVRVTIVWRQIG